jgi:hypothetical protein
MQQLELWIGLVELKPLDRKVFDAAGAFTYIVTWANDPESFRRRADVIAAKMELYVWGVEEVEPLAARVKRYSLTEELDDMVLRAESNPNAIVYGTFHCYPFNEA